MNPVTEMHKDVAKGLRRIANEITHSEGTHHAARLHGWANQLDPLLPTAFGWYPDVMACEEGYLPGALRTDEGRYHWILLSTAGVVVSFDDMRVKMVTP